MKLSGKATPRGVALSEITGFAGNEGAVSITDYTMPTAPGISQNRSRTASALAKTAIVALLARLLEWSPSVAMVVGKIVTRAWPGFRRA